MADVKKKASAGTLESSDVYVELAPDEKSLELSIESVVSRQFGESIRETVLDVLKQQNVEMAVVRIIDRGALECVIRARVETAVLRAREGN